MTTAGRVADCCIGIFHLKCQYPHALNAHSVSPRHPSLNWQERHTVAFHQCQREREREREREWHSGTARGRKNKLQLECFLESGCLYVCLGTLCFLPLFLFSSTPSLVSTPPSPSGPFLYCGAGPGCRYFTNGCILSVKYDMKYAVRRGDARHTGAESKRMALNISHGHPEPPA